MHDPGDSPPDPASPAEIRLAAMNLLARREHSLKELRQKLRRRFPDEQLLEAELERLAGQNLQSDNRFAESYTRQRALRGYGPERLRRELQERGLCESAVDAALEQPGLDWRALACEVFRKRFGEPAPVEMKEKARRVRFMQYRGFDRDQFRHLVDP